LRGNAGYGLFRGVDRASFAAAFVDRLRGAGLTVGLTGAQDLVAALATSPPVSMPALYWTARISLVRRFEEITIFDAVFGAVFAADEGVLAGPSQRGRSDDRLAAVPSANEDGVADGAGLPWMTLPAAVAENSGAGAGQAVPLRLPSALEALADRPFEDLDADQLALLGGWLRDAVRNWPTRRSRRQRRDRTGPRIALRPTVARARRTGWEPLELVRTKPVRRPRRVVMLCDVSQSMQAQAAAYLHMMRALALVADAEVFAFATALTRLTTVLAHREPAVAVAAATEAVADRFGGTRIASNVRALLTSHHGDAVRGAIVIIGSDGWDSDPPADLAAAMARLRRRAYRVIWMNPRAGAPGFEPRVAAMAAALPYCDALLAADTFRSLGGVLAELSSTT
jgi:uncharacterized protein with von Willebrand factor type A (vWA) domain